MRMNKGRHTMGDEIVRLKTDEALLRELKGIKKPTAEQVKEQRVSFVFGSLDSESTITRDQVRKILECA